MTVDLKVHITFQGETEADNVAFLYSFQNFLASWNLPYNPKITFIPNSEVNFRASSESSCQ